MSQPTKPTDPKVDILKKILQRLDAADGGGKTDGVIHANDAMLGELVDILDEFRQDSSTVNWLLDQADSYNPALPDTAVGNKAALKKALEAVALRHQVKDEKLVVSAVMNMVVAEKGMVTHIKSPAEIDAIFAKTADFRLALKQVITVDEKATEIETQRIKNQKSLTVRTI